MALSALDEADRAGVEEMHLQASLAASSTQTQRRSNSPVALPLGQAHTIQAPAGGLAELGSAHCFGVFPLDVPGSFSHGCVFGSADRHL
jgi:hypothetical protein